MTTISNQTLQYHKGQLIPSFEHDLYVYKFTAGVGKELDNFSQELILHTKRKLKCAIKKPSFLLFISKDIENLSIIFKAYTSHHIFT